MSYQGKIIIKKSYIKESNGLYRLITPIIENGKEYEVYVEVEKEYSAFLTPERADAQVYLTLPVALREGYNIYSETPVTEMFLHNLNEILIPHLALGDSRIHKIKIHAETDNTPVGGNGVGTGISCGVDSLFTLQEYTRGVYPDMDLTHLVIVSANVELWNTKNSDLNEWVKQHQIQFERYQKVCDNTGLPLVKIYSNYFHYVCGGDYNRDWSIYHHLYVHTYITMSAILALKKLFKIYYYSSAEDFTYFTLADNMTLDAARYELLLMETLSVPDFFCFSGGASYDRVDKNISLMDNPLAHKVLHPCHSDGELNCTKPWCQKCLRSLIVFDYYDKLDLFKDVFDLESYRKKHFQYIYWTVDASHKPENEIFFKRLYDMVNEKYPEDVKRAERNYQWNISTTVPKEQFNSVSRSNNFLSGLILREDKPEKILGDFFKNKQIKKLYISGQSDLGRNILMLLKKSDYTLELFDYKTANAINCDACLIIDTADAVIKQRRDTLISRGVDTAKIYTIDDLSNSIKQQ